METMLKGLCVHGEGEWGQGSLCRRSVQAGCCRKQLSFSLGNIREENVREPLPPEGSLVSGQTAFSLQGNEGQASPESAEPAQSCDLLLSLTHPGTIPASWEGIL